MATYEIPGGPCEVCQAPVQVKVGRRTAWQQGLTKQWVESVACTRDSMHEALTQERLDTFKQ